MATKYQGKAVFYKNASEPLRRDVSGNSKEELVAAAKAIRIHDGYHLREVRLVSSGGRDPMFWSSVDGKNGVFMATADDVFRRHNEHMNTGRRKVR